MRQCSGSTEWIISLKGKNKPQPVLNDLKEFFAKLCQGDSYTEPLFQEIDKEKHLLPWLNETEVILALSKIKKTESWPDNMSYWVWIDNALLLAPVVTFIWNLSLCSYTWPEAWKESYISPLPKVAIPLQHQDFRGIIVTSVIARCFEKVVYHKFSLKKIWGRLNMPTGKDATAQMLWSICSITVWKCWMIGNVDMFDCLLWIWTF